MSRILALREKAKEKKAKIVLPEGHDKRVIQAASFLTTEGLADIILLGKKDEIHSLASEGNHPLDGIDIIDPTLHDKRGDIINKYFELRKHKGITPEDAEKTVMGKFVYYAALMVRMDLADGFVAGASYTTSNVVRAAIHCLRLDKDIGTVSSSFIMEMDGSIFGDNGLFAYGDCGVIPQPSAKQLAGIAISTSDLFHKIFDIEPHVAMLSYSTKGSAKSESIDTVLEALEKVKKQKPKLMIDGELQVDAAIVPEVAQRKCPDSEVAGRANVLIFPNLAAGNIAYKLSQRFGKARVVGPIMLGLDKPCSDLSRGCGWKEIVDAAVVTAIRAQEFLMVNSN